MAQRSLMRHPRSTFSSPTPSSRGRRSLTLLVVAVLGVAACGGSDDDAGVDEASATDSVAPEATGDVETESGSETFDPEMVAACLADAGYETTTSAELLSEQQVADQLTAFGQTESLTFDATTVAFAGEVSFYETPEQAAERAEQLGDVALAQRVVGNALINVAAGSEFDDAVAAAEACLGS